MTRAELEHAIRAACDVAEDSEVFVFGSQAILAQHPDAPAFLRKSIEVDIAPRNRPARVDLIDGALGEMSQFHQTYGFYVHGVPIETAILPEGWETRTIRLSNLNTRGNTGLCVEAHDLAASKLAAFRDKDRDYVRVLLQEGMVEGDCVRERIGDLPIDGERRRGLLEWLDATLELLGRQ